MDAITAKEVREMLTGLWPQLRHIWIFDRRLTLVPFSEIKDLLQNSAIRNEIFKEELFDCDDFALVTNAMVKLETAKLKLKYPWAFGEAAMIQTDLIIHNQNILITDDLRVKLYEPQTGEFFEPGEGENLFYVRM